MNYSDPNEKKATRKFNKKIRQTLDNEPLDKDTLQQLANARYQALQQPQHSWFSRYAGPVAAFASVCVLAIAITFSLSPDEGSSKLNDPEAFEIITSNDAIEMYENMEFYLWMEEDAKT